MMQGENEAVKKNGPLQQSGTFKNEASYKHCVVCGEEGDEKGTLRCHYCPFTCHTACIASFSHLASFVPLNDSNTDAGDWKCPRCSGVPVRRSPPSHKAYRDKRFKLRDFLESVKAPSSVVFCDGVETRMDTCYSHVGKRPLFLSDLSEKHLQYQLAVLAQEAAMRGANYLDKLCEEPQKNAGEDTSDLLLYGSEVAWLLSNLLKFCDDSTTRLIGTCKTVGLNVLKRWHREYERSTSFSVQGKASASTDVDVTLAMLEGVSAARVLDPQGGEWDAMLASLHSILNGSGVVDTYIDFNPETLVGDDPMCPNCDMKLNRNKSLCDECDFEFTRPRRVIRYRRLTEALVWADLFSSLGLSLAYTTADVLRQARRCRPWRNRTELGVEDFKLQVYLVTHVMFILTDWGKYRLEPTDFPDEYCFLRHQLREAVALDDCEIVGEIVQSLRLFTPPDTSTQVGRWVNDALVYGVAFLLDRERRFGSQGRWVAQTQDFYVKMHSSYCAMLGMSLCRRSAHVPENDDGHRKLLEAFSPCDQVSFFEYVLAEDPPVLDCQPTATTVKAEMIVVPRPSIVRRLENSTRGEPAYSRTRIRCKRKVVKYGNNWFLVEEHLRHALNIEREAWKAIVRCLRTKPMLVLVAGSDDKALEVISGQDIYMLIRALKHRIVDEAKLVDETTLQCFLQDWDVPIGAVKEIPAEIIRRFPQIPANAKRSLVAGYGLSGNKGSSDKKAATPATKGAHTKRENPESAVKKAKVCESKMAPYERLLDKLLEDSERKKARRMPSGKRPVGAPAKGRDSIE